MTKIILIKKLISLKTVYFFVSKSTKNQLRNPSLIILRVQNSPSLR